MTEPGGRRHLEDALEVLRAEVDRPFDPDALLARVNARVDARVARGRAVRRGLVVAGCAAALVIAALVGGRLLRPVEAAGFRVVDASRDFRYRVGADAVLEAASGEARLELPALATRVELRGPVRLRREGAGVRVVAGSAAFEVEPRPGAALAVYVSGGQIEVLGTRFTVAQGEAGGEVELLRGAIRFVALDGRERRLAPGERLAWPLGPPEPAAAPSLQQAPSPAPPPPPRLAPQAPRSRAEVPPVPAPSPAPAPAPVADEQRAQQRRILAELDGLRMRGEEDVLARRLDELLAGRLAEPLRERLSFERCDVLAHRPDEAVRACPEIARHLGSYPGGEYTGQLVSLRAALRCP